MTVNELIEHLKALPVEHRALEARLWLPGTQFTIDGVMGLHSPGVLNRLPVVIVEGSMVPGSALQRDADEDITF